MGEAFRSTDELRSKHEHERLVELGIKTARLFEIVRLSWRFCRELGRLVRVAGGDVRVESAIDIAPGLVVDAIGPERDERVAHAADIFPVRSSIGLAEGVHVADNRIGHENAAAGQEL